VVHTSCRGQKSDPLPLLPRSLLSVVPFFRATVHVGDMHGPPIDVPLPFYFSLFRFGPVLVILPRQLLMRTALHFPSSRSILPVLRSFLLPLFFRGASCNGRLFLGRNLVFFPSLSIRSRLFLTLLDDLRSNVTPFLFWLSQNETTSLVRCMITSHRKS